jgi:hypothetical protein
MKNGVIGKFRPFEGTYSKADYSALALIRGDFKEMVRRLIFLEKGESVL